MLFLLSIFFDFKQNKRDSGEKTRNYFMFMDKLIIVVHNAFSHLLLTANLKGVSKGRLIKLRQHLIMVEQNTLVFQQRLDGSKSLTFQFFFKKSIKGMDSVTLSENCLVFFVGLFCIFVFLRFKLSVCKINRSFLLKDNFIQSFYERIFSVFSKKRLKKRLFAKNHCSFFPVLYN